MRAPALIAGMLALTLAWTLPFTMERSFTSHMITHMGVVAVASPLIAVGLMGSRLDPSGKFPRLFSPLLASVVDLVVVWLWHVPTLRELADAQALPAVAEQASFLAAGLLLWMSCLGGGRSGERAGAGAFGLLVTSVHMTLLGALLALAPRSLYATGQVTCFGIPLTAAEDQQIGGVVMLLLGAAVYLAGGVALLARVLTPQAGGLAR